MPTVDKLLAQDDTLQDIRDNLEELNDNILTNDYVKTVNGVPVSSGTHNVVIPTFAPTIKVNALTGSTVTISKGSTVLTPTEVSGTWTCTIPEWGYWTVTVTKEIEGQDDLVYTKFIAVNEVKRYEVNSHFIYGCTWSGSNTSACVRTDDAVGASVNPYYAGMTETPSSTFDSYYPWNKVEDVTSEDDDYATIGSGAYGDFVRIPKFWQKIEKSGTTISWKIAPYQVDSTYRLPRAFIRSDNTVRDYIYIAKYHCANDGTYRSLANGTPQVNQTRATFRSGCHLASNVWMLSYDVYEVIRSLYIVEFANFDAQRQIGYGCGNGSYVQSCTVNGTFSYHTGTALSSRTSYGVGVKYRNIVGLWDNCWDFCDGITFDGSHTYMSNDRDNFSDDYTTTGMTYVGERPSSASSNSIKSFFVATASGFEGSMFASEIDGDTSGSSYTCDVLWSGGTVLLVGGGYNQELAAGLFALISNLSASYYNSDVGSRLQILP